MRTSRDMLSVEKAMPFEPVHKEQTYYQIVVGNYGVVVPNSISPATLDGLQLVKGKASVITDLGLASRISEETGGEVLETVETFSKVIRKIVGGTQ